MWVVAVLVVALYCFTRGIVDLRARRFLWGALGLASGVALLLTPAQTNVVFTPAPVSPAR